MCGHDHNKHIIRINIDKKDLFKGETDKNLELWQNTIMHVPQNIFLADATIAENIAFGIKKENIDFALLESSAKRSQILDFINSLPNKFETVVGERGINLSSP